MAKRTTKARPKPAPQDLTLRNLRAMKKAITALSVRLRLLQNAVRVLSGKRG